ncbi:hypothetical protein RSAG8_01635, partial [Rhizoctonia solani AG-8 WAC10335]
MIEPLISGYEAFTGIVGTTAAFTIPVLGGHPIFVGYPAIATICAVICSPLLKIWE